MFTLYYPTVIGKIICMEYRHKHRDELACKTGHLQLGSCHVTRVGNTNCYSQSVCKNTSNILVHWMPGLVLPWLCTYPSTHSQRSTMAMYTSTHTSSSILSWLCTHPSTHLQCTTMVMFTSLLTPPAYYHAYGYIHIPPGIAILISVHSKQGTSQQVSLL